MIFSPTTAHAKLTYIRMSSSKIVPLLKNLAGKTYKETLIFLSTQTKRAAKIILSVLKSAVANAVTNLKFNKENLIISSAFVNKGPILKRIRPRAKGRAFAIQKKYSHITINLINSKN